MTTPPTPPTQDRMTVVITRPAPPKPPGAGFKDYVRSVFGELVSVLSGGAGVLLTFASPFAPSTWVATPLVAFGVLGFAFANYRVWSRERQNCIGLQKQIRSQGKLQIEYIPGVRGFDETEKGLYEPVSQRLSIRIRNIGGSTLRNCRLHVVKLEPDDGKPVGELRVDRFKEVNLHADESAFYCLATYKGPGTHAAGDTHGALYLPVRSTRSKAVEEIRALSLNTVYLVRLKVTAEDAASCLRWFRVEIRNHHLTMMSVSE